MKLLHGQRSVEPLNTKFTQYIIITQYINNI